MPKALSRREADIISAIQLSADRPLSLIAKDTGYKIHTVRYVVSDLLARGVIKPYILVNLFKLGLAEIECFVSLRFKRPADRAQFTKFILKLDQVTWFEEVGSDFQYGFAVSARRPEATRDLLAQIGDKFGAIVVDKQIAQTLGWTIFRRKYLSSLKLKTTKRLSVGYDGKEEQVDELDSKLLGTLCKEPLISYRDLARSQGLSASTVEYRIQRLKRMGVHCGTLYAVDCAKFGYMPFRVHVSLKACGKHHRQRLADFAASNDYSMSFIEYLGGWDCGFHLEVPEPSAAARFERDLMDSFSDIVANVRSIPIVAEHKASGMPD